MCLNEIYNWLENVNENLAHVPNLILTETILAIVKKNMYRMTFGNLIYIYGRYLEIFDYKFCYIFISHA